MTCDKVFLGLGSNLRSPERQIRTAVKEIQKVRGIVVVKSSSLYFTQPLGRSFQPFFCNAVLLIATSLTPSQLLQQCQALENKHNRVRKRKWGSRTLDIDLLLYGALRLQTPSLTIPHPELLNRDFVLKPLLEICPDFQLDKLTH